MKNEYEIRGNVTVIYLKSKKYGDKETIISTSQLQKVMEFPNSWCVIFDKHASSFYVFGVMPKVNGKAKAIRLHRLIVNAPYKMHVDHFNHDTLDNTDNNLRLCTNSENQQNLLKAKSNSKSGIRGVHWHKRSGTWHVGICLNRKQIFIGCFDDIEEAKAASVQAREKYFPFSQESIKKIERENAS